MGDANSEPSQSLSKQSITKASNLLTSHWQNGTTLDELPADLKPNSIADGYEIQKQIIRLTSSALWGWKIAATSIHGQKHINVDRPLAGHILKKCVTPYGKAVSLGSNRMKVAELELAFRVGEDMPPRPDHSERTVDEVMQCVDGMFLGSEIPDSRYQDFISAGAPSLIADNACADKYVLGPEVQNWRERDLVEHRISGWVVGDGEVREGKGGNVLGDPKIAMTWIANELNRYGMELKKGQYVTTGTCVFPLSVKPGDKVVGDYGDFGRLEVEFVE